MVVRGLRDRAGERGQALIEFALIVPFVLILIILILDFGMALDRREVMIHALREGTRAAANGDSVIQIQDTTVDQSEGNLARGDVTVCYQNDNGNGVLGDAGDSVHVSINHTYHMFASGILGVLPANLDMGPDAEAPLLNPASGTPNQCP